MVTPPAPSHNALTNQLVPSHQNIAISPATAVPSIKETVSAPDVSLSASAPELSCTVPLMIFAEPFVTTVYEAPEGARVQINVKCNPAAGAGKIETNS